MNISSKKFFLKNNIPVKILHKPDSPMYLECVFDAGNAYIGDFKKHGLPHFVEHLLLSGSQNNPTKDLLFRYFDTLGASVGAATDRDCVYIWMSYPDHTDSLAIFSELISILKSPETQALRLEHERRIVDSEIKKVYSKTGLNEAYLQTVYKNTVYESDPLGTLDSLENFSKEDILWWNKTFVHSGNCSIYVVGDFNEGTMKEVLNQTFGTLPVAETVLPALFTKPEYVPELILDQKLLEIKLRYGFVFDEKLSSKDKIALVLINRLFSQSGSSLLTKRFREELKMTYSIDSGFSFRKLANDFDIVTGIPIGKEKVFMDEIKEFIHQLPSLITADLIEQEKARFIKRLPVVRQTSKEYLSLIEFADQIGVSTNEYISIFNSLTHEDVQKVLKIFDHERWVLVRTK